MSQPPHQSSTPEDGAQRQRLQRALAAAGVTSRRKAEELIVEGRVAVDGQIVTELGTTIDPIRQRVTVDGVAVRLERQRYILLNKPKGYITTVSDERGRQTVMDLVDVQEHVKPVGRLDRPSEGLLFFTNDGELAYRIMHPSYEIEKEYEVDLDGHPPPDALERVRRGITMDGERVTPSVVRPMRNEPDGTVVRVVIHEGRNRVVRRMFEAIGYPVLRLRRTRIGPLQIGSIARGQWRDLTAGELEQIRQAVHLDDAGQARAAPQPRGGERRNAPPRGRRPAPTHAGGRGPDRRRPADGSAERSRGGPDRRRETDRARPPDRAGRPAQPQRSGRPDQRPDRPPEQPSGGPPRRPPGSAGEQRTGGPPRQGSGRPTEQQRSGTAGKRRDGPPGRGPSGPERRAGPPRDRSGPERRSRPPNSTAGSDRRPPAGPPNTRRPPTDSQAQRPKTKRPEPPDE